MVQLVDDDSIGDPLPVLEESFTIEEVSKAIHKLKRGKACGMMTYQHDIEKLLLQTQVGSNGLRICVIHVGTKRPCQRIVNSPLFL